MSLFCAVTGYPVIVSSYFHLWEGDLQWRKEGRMDLSLKRQRMSFKDGGSQRDNLEDIMLSEKCRKDFSAGQSRRNSGQSGN